MLLVRREQRAGPRGFDDGGFDCGGFDGGRVDAVNGSALDRRCGVDLDHAGASGAGADACTLVTVAMLKSTIHLDAGAPTAKASSTGGSSCTFQAKIGLLDGTGIVQTSTQPELYFPDSLSASADGAVKVTAPGVDRGWVNAQATGGTVLVVKVKIGVMVNYNVPHANATAADAQHLAAALARAL